VLFPAALAMGTFSAILDELLPEQDTNFLRILDTIAACAEEREGQ
jgi:hypothetical protein